MANKDIHALKSMIDSTNRQHTNWTMVAYCRYTLTGGEQQHRNKHGHPFNFNLGKHYDPVTCETCLKFIKGKTQNSNGTWRSDEHTE